MPVPLEWQALLNVLSAGDEIIAGSGLFGGTIDLFKDLEAFGITTYFIPHITVEDIKTVLNPNIKVVFGELIGNPGLDVVNIKEVTDFLHENGVPFIADATTATPYLVNALSLGADVVIHSSSKYINGSGNSISGIIVDGGKFKWDKDRYEGIQQIRKVCLHCKTSKRCVEKYGWVSRANECLPQYFRA